MLQRSLPLALLRQRAIESRFDLRFRRTRFESFDWPAGRRFRKCQHMRIREGDTGPLLGVPPSLMRCWATTNIIESVRTPEFATSPPGHSLAKR